MSSRPERLLEAGFAEGDVERILRLVPLATHNQRGVRTLFVGSEARVNAWSGSARSSSRR